MKTKSMSSVLFLTSHFRAVIFLSITWAIKIVKQFIDNCWGFLICLLYKYLSGLFRKVQCEIQQHLYCNHDQFQPDTRNRRSRRWETHMTVRWWWHCLLPAIHYWWLMMVKLHSYLRMTSECIQNLRTEKRCMSRTWRRDLFRTCLCRNCNIAGMRIHRASLKSKRLVNVDIGETI